MGFSICMCILGSFGSLICCIWRMCGDAFFYYHDWHATNVGSLTSGLYSHNLPHVHHNNVLECPDVQLSWNTFCCTSVAY